MKNEINHGLVFPIITALSTVLSYALIYEIFTKVLLVYNRKNILAFSKMLIIFTDLRRNTSKHLNITIFKKISSCNFVISNLIEIYFEDFSLEKVMLKLFRVFSPRKNYQFIKSLKYTIEIIETLLHQTLIVS